MEGGKVYLNKDEDDEMEIEGYRKHRSKDLLVSVGYLVTVGLLRLLFYWLPHLQVWATGIRCELGEAENILIKDHFKQYTVATVHTATREGTGVKIKNPSVIFGQKRSSEVHFTHQAQNDSSLIRFFGFKKIKYVWDVTLQSFMPLKGLDEGFTLSYFHQVKGLKASEQSRKRVLYGENCIAIHVTPVLNLLFKEVLSPFYVFQVFSMCVWYSDEYYIYATCIAVITTVSLTVTIYQTRMFEKALRNTISASTTVSVCRGEDGEFEDISSEDLVPGDVIEIPRHGCPMQCDAVLITGNCILNESMLTGESVPVTKTSLPNPSLVAGHDDPDMNMKQHSRHILFSGTQVIQTRFYGNQKVKAVVLRTGFNTAKGGLVRSILFPKPIDFKFQRHSYYFILVLAFLACMGFIYTIILMVRAGEEGGDIVIRSLDLITITVPPALPAALAVGVVFSQKRLKNQNVYCISPKGITLCGTIDAVCFDKTGTLTEEGLDMLGVVPVSDAIFDQMVKNVSCLPPCPLLTGMATCHSLTIIHNEVVGDPLDLIMFHATNWELEEPGSDETRFDSMVPTVVKPKSSALDVGKSDWAGDGQPQGCDVGIVRQFPFSSSLQRMSVVTRKLGSSQFELYVKGSPEMVTSLSRPETVPKDFLEQLQYYTQHGYRVIGLAWKPLPSKLNYVKIQRILRDSIENDLIFLGLLIMENRLKPQSAPTIAILNHADIRTIMVTGDNMLTAVSVARECGIVEDAEKTILVQAYPPEKGEAEVKVEFVETHTGSGDNNLDSVLTMEESGLELEEKHRDFHLAVPGTTWEIVHQHCPALLKKLVVKGTVFARMSPDQKAQVVEVLQDIGYYVGMCGDGANDCGALKKAHMGISLSEAEASVASPFTSKTPTIECVPNVIREGRAALVTSFGIFKYMALYSLTQFISVLLLYWIGANLTDFEFLYIDLFIITSFSITFSWTIPYPKLVKERPLISLISPGPILSIISQTALIIAAQTFAFLNVKEQSWYMPLPEFEDEDDEIYQCDDNTAVFLSSIYLYCILAITFSKGAPFRGSIFSNYFFLLNIVVAMGTNLWLTLYPTKEFGDFMELEIFPSLQYRATYIALAAICFFVSIIMEKLIIDNDALRTRIKKLLSKWHQHQGSMYQIIESEIDSNPHWPPVSSTKVPMADLFNRLEGHHEFPPHFEKTRVSLERLLDNDDESQDDIISLEDAEQEPSSNAEIVENHVINVESSSLHLNPLFSSPDTSTSETQIEQPLHSGSSALDILLEISHGSGKSYDKDGAINTPL